MTILTYIIASLLKKYRFKKEAENLKNLLNDTRFACQEKSNALPTGCQNLRFHTGRNAREIARIYASSRQSGSSVRMLKLARYADFAEFAVDEGIDTDEDRTVDE